MKNRTRESLKDVVIGFGALVAVGAGAGAGFAVIDNASEPDCEDEIAAGLPIVRGNQALLLHPDYLSGNMGLGYTLFTDTDYSGDWEIAEVVRARLHYPGFALEGLTKTLYILPGISFGQSYDGKVEVVDESWFEPYNY